MTTRVELTRRVLLALHAMGGQPASHDVLVDAVTLRFQPRPTRGDVEEAIQDAESKGYISGISEDLEGVLWGLTPAGKLKARSLQ